MSIFPADPPQCSFLPLYVTDLLLDCYTGKVSNVLIRPCKGVKKRGLSTVLISCKGKSHIWSFSSVFSISMFFCVLYPERQLVASKHNIKRVAHWRTL